MIHTTKDGHEMAIVDMDDSHLLNTVKVYLATIDRARVGMEKPTERSDFEKALYGLKDTEKARESLERRLKNAMTKLPHYMLEVLLRGLEGEVLYQLQTAFGRTSSMNTMSPDVKDNLSIINKDIY